MKTRTTIIAVAGASALMVLVFSCGCSRAPRPADVIAAFEASRDHAPLNLVNPLNGALFPRDMAPPTFRWKTGTDNANLWYVAIGDGGSIARSPALDTTAWRPSDEQWEAIKKASLEKSVTVAVVGIARAAPGRILCATEIAIRTSSDAVETPIFYREVNLPFLDAVKDPSRIRWRFGSVSSKKQPPIVLDNLPVCGNCHSFSADGGTFGMDVDYANDKGSYAIAPVSKMIVLDHTKIITWNDYKKEDKQPTFGLLSQVSPSGRYVVSTVKDQSVFVPKPDLSYSQLFFPIKGILAVHDRQAGTFAAVPGADAPAYVQSNPVWSPDEKYIVFARAEAYHLRNVGTRILLSPGECEEFLKGGKTFLFDLYRVPFNGGKGGTPEPLAGASANRVSNFFPRYSPDGKWIVFCKAKSFMLLQPDSELYIMPAAGGEARRLTCNNVEGMNSWHSWSPNGKWLVFSSKRNGPYTQLFLTHIDTDGNSSTPVLLDWFTSPDRAANIPEFVARTPRAIGKIKEHFVDEVSFVRAGTEFLRSKDLVHAEECFRRSLALNPKHAEAHHGLGCILMDKGELAEARAHFEKCIDLDPELPMVYSSIASLLIKQGDHRQAVRFLQKAASLDPDSFEVFHQLGLAFDTLGHSEQAMVQYRKAIRINPQYATAYFSLGTVLQCQGKMDQAMGMYRKTIDVDPTFAGAFYNLGLALWSKGRVDEATAQFRKALEVGGDATPARNLLSELQKQASVRRNAIPSGSPVRGHQ